MPSITKEQIAYGVGVLGILGMTASGYLTITTPEAQECQVSLADKSARLELTTTRLDETLNAMDKCATALDALTGGSP